jgi:small subunit ribosomal protein S6
MIIVDAGLDDGAIQTVLTRATELVSSRGGSTPRLDRWGRRRFAYELKHRWEGYYALLETTAEPSVMDELDRVLSLADEVIRHKIIRVPDGVAARSRPVPSGPAETTGAAEATGATEADANGNGA